MKRKIFLGVGLMVVTAIAYVSGDSKPELAKTYPESVQIVVENPLQINRTDATVRFKVKDLFAKAPQFNPNAFVVLSGGNELASQSIDLDGDTQPDRITFVTDFKASEKKEMTIRYAVSGKMSREYVRLWSEKSIDEIKHKHTTSRTGR